MIFEDPKETVLPMTGVQRTHYAVMKTLKRNFAVASIRLRNVTRPLAFLEERKAAGERITFTTLVIKAIGVTLEKHPKLGWMMRGQKLVHPSTADIGCSVGTDSPVSPVVVVRDAAHKSLIQINEELVRLAKAAKEQEAAELQKYERLARLVPINWLFRFFVWILMTRQKFIRHSVGNFQVSILNNSSMDLAVTAMTAVSTIMMGRIKDRALVEDGQVVIRKSAYFTFHYDHAIHGAKDGTMFLDELCRLLDHPEELL